MLADNLTKYVHLYPCKTTDATGVIRILKKFCDDRGIQERIISDRGTCFTSRAFQEFCREQEIAHTLNSTRHPQTNGQVERANRTILPLLSMSTTDQRRWDTRVKDVELLLNTAVNKTTSKTPYEALHGYLPRFRAGVLSSLSRTRNDYAPPEQLQGKAREIILHEQTKMKTRYDRRHFDGIRYEVGEVVVMLKQPAAGQPSKLQAKYREKPLQIMKVLPNDTYRVAELAAGGREIFTTTAHVSQLRSWRLLRDKDDIESEDENSSNEGDEKQSADEDEDDQPAVSQQPAATTISTQELRAVRPSRSRQAPAR